MNKSMRIGTEPLDRETLKGLLEPLRATDTAYLPARSDLPDPATALQIHWSNLRRSLAANGASEADLAAIDVTANEAEHGGDTNVAIAAEGELRSNEAGGRRIRDGSISSLAGRSGSRSRCE